MAESSLRLPAEFRKPLLSAFAKRPVKRILRHHGINTVCEEARCPNIGECFLHKTATFMIMGDRCTRRCKFCAVTTKKPKSLDLDEPQKIARAALEMGLNHIVITSVDRDDLPDLGATHFAQVVKTVKAATTAKIEVLTPDFQGRDWCLDEVLGSGLDIFGHNIESVPRIYHKLRPQSHFSTSLRVLSYARTKLGLVVKSGMMVGVGETDEEVLCTMTKLKDAGVQIVTIGQYLRPSRKHWPVQRYVTTSSYGQFMSHGQALGLHVYAGPFVRSSYHAHEAYAAMTRVGQHDDAGSQLER